LTGSGNKILQLELALMHFASLEVSPQSQAFQKNAVSSSSAHFLIMHSFIFVVLCSGALTHGQSAPVTRIAAINRNGQTFVTWSEPYTVTSASCTSSTAGQSACFRYNLYRSTTCPITASNVSSATEIEYALFNNSGQANGPKPFDQATRQNGANPMATLTVAYANLPMWTGVGVYTNLAAANACYAVITHDTTGVLADSPISAGNNSMTGTIAETPATIQPILQLPSTDSTRSPGTSCLPGDVGCTGLKLACSATSTHPGIACTSSSQCLNGSCSVAAPTSTKGLPMFLKLHPSALSTVGNDLLGAGYVYWGDTTMSYQDGVQANFSTYDPHGGLLGSYCIGGPNKSSACSLGKIGNAACSELPVGSGSTITRASNVVTAVLNNGKSGTLATFLVNDPINVAGVTDASFDGGPFTLTSVNINSVNLTTTVTWNQAGANSSSEGGTITEMSTPAPTCDGGSYANEVVVSPQDTAWTVNGNAAVETLWFGNRSTEPINTGIIDYTYPFTENKLNFLTNFNVSHYGLDTTRLFGIGSSMGAMGSATWTLRQYETYAAVYLRDPVAGLYPHIYNLTPTNSTWFQTTASDLLPNGEVYNVITDTAAWVPLNCALNLPFVAMSDGRNDTPAQNRWLYFVQLANALATCHYAFAAVWNNGIHGTATEHLLDPLQSQYETLIYKNRSMPAFTGFSLDANIGNGSATNGDCQTGTDTGLPCYINYGWHWTNLSDTSSTWSVSFTNAQVTSTTGTATVNVTARNTQSFKPTPGSKVPWTATGGQKGTATVDIYGLATAVGVKVAPGVTTTLTMQ
jgi:hypothetical protein